MSAADKIQTARALIEPLTDTTPGPWVFSERNTPEHFWIEPEVGYLPMPHYLSVSGPISRENAALIAAAPALRDTVAALADLADAQAQENARLTDRAVSAATDALLEMDLRNVGAAEYVAARIRAALGDAP